MKRTHDSFPAFEALEPRFLLSGNPSPAGIVGALKCASEAVVADAGSSVAIKAKGAEVAGANAACNAASGPASPAAQRAGKGDSLKVAGWGQVRPVWFTRNGTALGCGAICPAGDVDTQTFIAPKSGALSIELIALGRHSTLAGQVSVYDAKGNLVAKVAGTARASAVTTVDVLKGQRYYVRISGVGNARGAYVVRYRFAEAPPDRAPVAGDDCYSLDEDGTLVAASVLANDTDPEGQALSATLVAGVAHGALTLKPDGSFLYTPDADFNGTDFFTYTAGDGKNLSNPATVVLTVRPVNDAPVAQDDLFEVPQNNTLTMPVLDNDGDKDGDPLSVALASGASHGVVEYDNDGSIKYTPAPNFTGVDSFTYRAFDGLAYSDPVTVTVNVVPLKIAQDDAYTMTAGTVLTVKQPGVLANDLVSTGWAVASLSTGPQHGTLQNFDLFGGFTYVPTAGFTGADTFTYTVNDGTQYSNIATVTITVNPAGQAVA